MLGLPERALGGPPAPDAPFALPRLDVCASAGPGADAGGEAVLGIDSVDPALARALRLRPGRAGLIAVAGDSMEPELHDGDQLVVNLDEREPGPRGQVFVVRIEGALLVKRVRTGRGGPIASSDNPAAPALPPGEVEVVGRVVWRMGAPR